MPAAKQNGVSFGFVVWTTLSCVLSHWLLWLAVCMTRGEAWRDFLNHWDAGWYTQIVEQGYGGQSWAFFPLYPLTVKTFTFLTANLVPVPILGTLISTAIFAGFVALTLRLREDLAAKASGLVPTSRAAWLVFLLTPASYIFTSHHTESLFLLLSFSALIFASRSRWIAAALLAGLASVTRIQGIFLAAGIAYWACVGHTEDARRPQRFFISGLISALIFSTYLFYQDLHAGTPFAFIASHDKWAHKASGEISVMINGLLMANPWQERTAGTILHHAAFFLLCVAVWLSRRLPRGVVLYLLLCVAVIPWQGEFVDVYRFGAVLFPALYVAGNRIEELPVWVRTGIAVGALALNVAVTYAYAISRWAY